LRAVLEGLQVLGVVRLNAQVVDAGTLAAGRDGEVHRRVVEHPLGVVGLGAGRAGVEQAVVEGDAAVEVLDVQVDVKALHGGFSSAGTGQGGGWIGRDRAGLALAAVRGEVGQQGVHVLEAGAVDQVPALALAVHQAGL
ncbi:hypothetical protein RZS08_32120, partial [Arthrospira platensis SPKY1]|nr:hypothetical protein [Arthrospira platensis SPKY1]